MARWVVGNPALVRHRRADGEVAAPLIALRIAVTFILVTVGWLFFRLTNFGDIVLLFDEMLKHKGNLPTTDATITSIYLPPPWCSFSICRSSVFPSANASTAWRRAPNPTHWGALAAVVIMAPGSRNAFIYFQF